MKISTFSVAVMLALLSSTALAETSNDPLPTILTSLTSELGDYLAALAGTSALVVALLEAYKKLFSIRGKFHRTAVLRWLYEDSAHVPPVAKAGLFSSLLLGGGEHYAVKQDRTAKIATARDGVIAYSSDQAYAEFFHLTSGQAKPETPKPSNAVLRWRSIDRAVFELETSRMMSQIQDAADAVLNNPAGYPHLYAFLTRGSAADAEIWKKYLESNQPPTKEQSDRYGRIKLLVRRQLDAFQTVTTCRWTDLNQWWAILAGVAVLFTALVIAAGSPADSPNAFHPLTAFSEGWSSLWASGALIGVLIKAALGGALAPVAKDLLNNISSLRFTR